MRTKGTDVISYNVTNLPIRYSLMVKNDIMSFPEINHWHDDMEFITVTKGMVRIDVNGKIYDIYEGQMLFINSRQMHHAVWDEDGDWVYKQITIHPDVIFNNEYLTGYYDKLCGENMSPMLVFSTGSQRQKAIIDGVLGLFEQLYKNTNEFAVISGVYSLLSRLMDYLENRPKAKTYSNKNLKAMYGMVSCIQEHYRERLPLNDIAAAGGIGRSKCCELFKEYWNMSPNDYLNMYRLEKSVALFKDDKLSISEIAKQSGFKGASYYAETFRKVIKMSPTEYRNNTSIKMFSSKKS